MANYDVSQLSAKPLLFHCHPEEYEIMVMPPNKSNICPEQYRDQVTKFFSATPSGADYAVIADFIEQATSPMTTRSFIVHSLGTTECTYTPDLELLNKMSLFSRWLRDQVLFDFNWNELGGRDIAPMELVEHLVSRLNRKLPPGFSISLYPPGHIIDNTDKPPA